MHTHSSVSPELQTISTTCSNITWDWKSNLYTVHIKRDAECSTWISFKGHQVLLTCSGLYGEVKTFLAKYQLKNKWKLGTSHHVYSPNLVPKLSVCFGSHTIAGTSPRQPQPLPWRCSGQLRSQSRCHSPADRLYPEVLQRRSWLLRYRPPRCTRRRCWSP